MCSIGKGKEIKTYFAGIQHGYAPSYKTDKIFAECLNKYATGDKKYTKFWKRILKYHDKSELRLTAAKALIKLGDEDSVEMAMSKDPSLTNRKRYKKMLLGF